MSLADSNVIEWIASILLFTLVFGMSATVNVSSLLAQLTNMKALAAGLGLQFIVMPWLGWVVVRLLPFDRPTAIILLVVTSSPGGSFSNWWSSLFNADLALSVTLTALSTVLSIVMLPLNLVLYARHAFRNNGNQNQNEEDVVDAIHWGSVIWAILIVILGIACGLLASAYYHSHSFHVHANKLGNVAGIILIIFTAIIANSTQHYRIWNRDLYFYLGIALPCMFGLIFSTLVTSILNLPRPERLSASIESCYQNIGIATSVALTMFEGENQALALGVPFYYGFVEAVILFAYCIAAWKAGWTKAPQDVTVWEMITTSYEVVEAEQTLGHVNAEKDGFYYVDHADVHPSAEMASNKTPLSDPLQPGSMT